MTVCLCQMLCSVVMPSVGSVKTIKSSFWVRFLALTLLCSVWHTNLCGDLKCFCVWCGCSWPGPSWQPVLSICSIKKRKRTLVHFELAQQRLCGLTGTTRSENSDALNQTLARFPALHQTFSCLLLLCTVWYWLIVDKDVTESKQARMAHVYLKLASF